MTIEATTPSRGLVDRVKAILMSPKTEWPVIAAEPATAADLYKNYAVILAALPAIAGFIQMSIVGVPTVLGTIRVGVATGLVNAIVSYILQLVGIYVLALVIDWLAPRFGGTQNKVQALKVAVYSATAAWVAGMFNVLPYLGWLIAFVGALYTLYLLYLGLPVLMRTAADKALPYTGLVIVAVIVLWLLITMVLGIFAGGAMMMGGGFGAANSVTSTATNDVRLDPNSALGQLEAYGKRLEQANKEFEAAQASGNAEAQQAALGKLMGSALGGNGATQAVAPDQLRALLPAQAAGMNRTEISAERNAALGIQVSEARAEYSEGDKSLTIEITDMGGTAGLMAIAAWANVEQDKESDSGYERTSKQNGQFVHEQWDRESNSGEFQVIVGNRFAVKVTGTGTMDMLKSAAAAIDVAKLQSMATVTR
jgi:hypothetical protein